jgi:predicted oxidoreductase
VINRVKMCPDGPEFSELVQGYWRMQEWQQTAQESLSFAKQHVELGLTTVDHAHLYGGAQRCEELFGAALRLDPSFRHKIEIISKCGIELVEQNPGQVNHYDSSSSTISHSVDTSLSRLGIDHLDVLLIHRPDWLMNVDQIAVTFAQLIEAGKVLHFGVSNFTPSQFSLLQSRLPHSLVTNQVEINPLNFDVVADGTLDQLQQARVRPMAWSCLAGGRLFSGESKQISRLTKVFKEIAQELGSMSIDQVIYAWVMRLPSKPVAIIGSGNIERIKSAAESTKLELSQEQWYRVWVAAKGYPVP